MSIDATIQQCLKRFLQTYCPAPEKIEADLLNSQFIGIEDRATGDHICTHGRDIQSCWFILSGRVEILVDHKVITERFEGEMIGEQELLRSLVRAGDVSLAACDVVARGRVRLIRLSRAFQERFTAEQQAVWGLTLAAVVNEKLQQATDERSRLQKYLDERERLLGRFAEGEALGVVKREADGEATFVRSRDVIIWFSDVANFSNWAVGKEPGAIAETAKKISQIQIDQIRAARGEVDKILGDGVMAVWFIDAESDRRLLPRRAVECAKAVVREVRSEFGRHRETASLDIRIGLHCGAVSFGDFGAKERIAVTVMGHAVNMAARYEQAKSDNLQPIRMSPEMRTLLDASDPGASAVFASTRVQVKHGVEIDVFTTT